MHRRSITSLYKHRIHSVKLLYCGTAETVKNFWTMNTQNLSTLQKFQSSSHQCKSLFLQSCPEEFIQFLCECVIELLKGNLQSIKRHHVQIFKARFEYCLQDVQLGSKEETFWRPMKAYSSLKLLLFPSLTICLDIEQFVLVTASVYKKSLISQSVTKQELPKYQPSQNPTY